MPEGTPLTRQELYQKVRERGKEAYILDEMKRLGFWPKDSAKPNLAETLIEERTDLQKQLRELSQQQQLYSDPEKALKELHRLRKKAALEKREATRQQNNERRYKRALNWHTTQQKLITFVGGSFSHGLKHVESDVGRLKAQSLPELHDSKSLADAMGISINELRFLTYQKDVSIINHYQRFEFVKKSGGMRKISAPMPRLKRSQYWILGNVFEPLALHDAAHGFVSERSILTNALPHVGKDVVINLDLKDFFPTISYARVKGVFKGLGYSEHLATILGLLCTEPDVLELEMDLKTWYVANGERTLPQGAPTSPFLSNLVCRKLDARLKGMASKLGFEYSRYADDMTFSANGKSDADNQKLLWRCRGIIKDEGFIVHPDKTKIMRKHKKQEVTGVVVNKKASVDRKTLKRFRALLFQVDKDGPQGKEWGSGNLFSSIDGYANFVAMINPEKGIPLQQKVTRLKLKYGQQYGAVSKPGRMGELNRRLMRIKAAAGQAPRAGWWQAQARPKPELELTHQQKHALKKAINAAENNGSEDRSSQQPLSSEPSASSNEQVGEWSVTRPSYNSYTHKAGLAMLFLCVLIILAMIFFTAP